MVFVPHDLERAKINMAAIFGSVILVRGNYDDVNRLCSELADERRWAFVNVNMRPYYSEGSKSLGFEWRSSLVGVLLGTSSCLLRLGRCSRRFGKV